MNSGTAQFHVPVKPLLELAAEDRLSDELVVSLAGQPALRDAGEYITPNTKILLALVITAVQDDYDWDISSMQACARVFEEQGYVRLRDLAAIEELELDLYTAHPDFPAAMIAGLKSAIQRAHQPAGTNGGAPTNQLPLIKGIGKRRLDEANQSQQLHASSYNPGTVANVGGGGLDGQPATKKHRPSIVLFNHPETHTAQPVTSHPSTHGVNTQTTAGTPVGNILLGQRANANVNIKTDADFDLSAIGGSQSDDGKVHSMRYVRRQGVVTNTKDGLAGGSAGAGGGGGGGNNANSDGENDQSEEVEESDGVQSETSAAGKKPETPPPVSAQAPAQAQKKKKAEQPVPAAAAAAAAPSETSDQDSVSSPATTAVAEGQNNPPTNAFVQPMYPAPYPWGYPWPVAPQFFRPMAPPMPQKPLATRYHTLHVGGGRKERFSVSKTIMLRPPKPSTQQQQSQTAISGAVPGAGRGAGVGAGGGSDSDVGNGEPVRFYEPEEKLICPFGCGKGFNSRDKLDDHANTHTGKKPYVCPKEGCGKAMPTRQALTMHQSRAHSNDLPHKFVCPTPGCGASFPFKSSFDRHVRDGQHNKQQTTGAGAKTGGQGQANVDIIPPGQQIRPAPSQAQSLQNNMGAGGFKFSGCQMCVVPYCGRWLYTRAEYDRHIAEHQKNGQWQFVAPQGGSGNAGNSGNLGNAGNVGGTNPPAAS